MSSLPILQSLKESILTANVKAVYGEPIAAQGKTVIPIAKLIYGFGGGAGTGGVGNSGTRGEGGGGGGVTAFHPKNGNALHGLATVLPHSQPSCNIIVKGLLLPCPV